MRNVIEGVILWVLLLGIILVAGCHDDKPIETKAPVMAEDKAGIEHQEPEIIQEYPRITTADLEQLEAQAEEEAIDEGLSIEGTTPIEEEASDCQEEAEPEEGFADTWEEEWTEEDTWEEEPIEEEWIEEEPAEEWVEEETIEEGIEMVDAAEEESGMAYLGNYQITAYEWTGNPCANGNYPSEGYTVACNSLPMGTVVYIEGVGYRTVEDRGATWHSDQWIDLYLGDVNECFSWGIKYLDVWAVE